MNPGITNKTESENQYDYSSILLKVFPNPANNSLTVDISNVTAGTYKIEFLNLLGELCNQYDYYLTNNKVLQLPLESLADGIYCLRINKDNLIVAYQTIVVIH